MKLNLKLFALVAGLLVPMVIVGAGVGAKKKKATKRHRYGHAIHKKRRPEHQRSETRSIPTSGSSSSSRSNQP